MSFGIFHRAVFRFMKKIPQSSFSFKAAKHTAKIMLLLQIVSCDWSVFTSCQSYNTGYVKVDENISAAVLTVFQRASFFPLDLNYNVCVVLCQYVLETRVYEIHPINQTSTVIIYIINHNHTFFSLLQLISKPQVYFMDMIRLFKWFTVLFPHFLLFVFVLSFLREVM